jgi:hypothetical protein
MTDTNPRDLIKRLADIADALDGRNPLVSAQGQAMDGFTALANFRALAAEARVYLAQPEPEEPTDEELLALMPESMRDDFSYAAKVASDATGGQAKPGIFRICLNHSALEYARAVLDCSYPHGGSNSNGRTHPPRT